MNESMPFILGDAFFFKNVKNEWIDANNTMKIQKWMNLYQKKHKNLSNKNG